MTSVSDLLNSMSEMDEEGLFRRGFGADNDAETVRRVLRTIVNYLVERGQAP